MNLPKVETMDGYRIYWVSSETHAEIKTGLRNGEWDGLGFNPYRGWTRNVAEFLTEDLQVKALVIPFGDKIGFNKGLIFSCWPLEMLLLSEFSGDIRIEGKRLMVLRLLAKSGAKLGALPLLRTLHVSGVENAFFQRFPATAPNVDTLELNDGPLNSLGGLEELHNIRHLEISYLRALTSIAPIAKLPHLRTLYINSIKKLADISEALKELKSLRVLRIINCGSIPDLSFLDDLQLEELTCSRTKVPDKNYPALSKIKTVFIG